MSRIGVAGLVVLLGGVVAALVLAGCGGRAPARAALAQGPTRGSGVQIGAAASEVPSVFAVVSSPAGTGSYLELRSVATASVVDRLGRLGGSWTGNGFALSPDARSVYLTLIPHGWRWHSLLLEQASVSTHARRLIAHGEQPSISPDGHRLAYAAGEDRSARIVVRQLSSGRRRSIDVAGLLGGHNDMLNASLAWLGDGNQVAVYEACCPVPVSATAAGGRPGIARRHEASYGVHLIVVSIRAHGPLTARRVALPRAAQMPNSIGTDASRPNSLLVSYLISEDRAAVDRLTIGSRRATLARVLTIAHALVWAFAPSGQRLLYLVGHSPPNLWTATIENDQLTQRHRLIQSSALQALAW